MLKIIVFHFFIKLCQEYLDHCLLSSHYVIYDRKWASFLSLGKSSHSFLSLNHLLKFYPLCFQCHELSLEFLQCAVFHVCHVLWETLLLCNTTTLLTQDCVFAVSPSGCTSGSTSRMGAVSTPHRHLHLEFHVRSIQINIFTRCTLYYVQSQGCL